MIGIKNKENYHEKFKEMGVLAPVFNWNKSKSKNKNKNVPRSNISNLTISDCTNRTATEKSLTKYSVSNNQKGNKKNQSKILNNSIFDTNRSLIATSDRSEMGTT